MKYATFVFVLLSLTLLSSCATGPARTAGISEISLEHAGCADDCPRFRATLFRDGRVDYFGQDNAPFAGKWTARIPVHDFALLAQLVEQQNYFVLQAQYGEPGTHFGPITTSVVRNGVRHTVIDHGYHKPEGPLSLQWVEAAIEVVLRRAGNWTKSD